MEVDLTQKFPAKTYIFHVGTSTFKEINLEFYLSLFPSLLGEGPGVGWVESGVTKSH
jgi:hypothetical protein